MNKRESAGTLRVTAGTALEPKHLQVLTAALGALRPRLGFECSGPLCICTGDADCNDMFGTSLCGDAICFEDAVGGVVCLCLRNRAANA
ncbi:MAG: hypothetical protein ABI534_02195 [Chloroflexota bacterium]